MEIYECEQHFYANHRFMQCLHSDYHMQPFQKKNKATMANEWEHCDNEELVMYIF